MILSGQNDLKPVTLWSRSPMCLYTQMPLEFFCCCTVHSDIYVQFTHQQMHFLI